MRITIRYKMLNWSSWTVITVYDVAEARRWICTLKQDGYVMEVNGL